MKSRRGKHAEPFWPSTVMRKWLNIKPKVHEFSEDEADTESEDEDTSNNIAEMSFTTVGSQVTYTSQASAKGRSSRLRRRKSETLRVQYISNKDVRVMIGTWNVAGRFPSEEVELDEWLCKREPADIYILGFQEVVPLNAGNILGAEDNRPIPKWESIIRRTLNSNSLQSKPSYKSYSAPPSPVSRAPLSDSSLANKVHVPGNHAFERGEQDKSVSFGKNFQWNRINSNNYSNKLDWPEYSLDKPQKDIKSRTKLRRVLSSSQGIGFGWLDGSKVYSSESLSSSVGLKRVYRSSGNLGMLWSEREEASDVLESLKDVSDKSSEEDSSPENEVERGENEGSGECSNPRPRFVRIVSKQMVGIYISVWVCRRLRRHVNNLKVSPVGVGLMGYMGNKGSVSVSMSLFQTRFCFVCSHLTSGHKEGDQQKRNSDVHDILQRTRFSSIIAVDQPQTIPSHDRIFWFGDLNYRLNMSDAGVRKLVAMKQWDELMNYDQLNNEIRRGHIFDGWMEGLIDFPPTYKYEINSNKYVGENAREGEKRRSPAWCDRILWFGKGIRQLSYWSSELDLSDHRPVSSIFYVEVEVFNEGKLQRALNFTNPELLPENLCFEEN
ncbi:type I inositol polyphosphate 5-phosphatase 2 isoform X1 [Asparagus officinalis]|uniref:type I inositol polyphosphate 5-phosphatase 2 isoform X1 n=2 Tax=Asparagus officinalis TaxID=4686 RepID=UPI00098E166F|nr:type I inositol polyphosphate 5-phosphatase 2 isoform X1 [Asparagus officinalis]XP_020243936.1 type I inositol polyphosphate 5-phosphatase 2 isoform X1 [Asparagus officinalis]